MTSFIPKFVNRSREQMYQKVLRALEDRGPCPQTVLAYRAEMNDKQVQTSVEFLEARKMVARTPLNDKIRLKIAMHFSLCSKDMISITTKGTKYLAMLDKLESQIDWDKFDTSISWRKVRNKK